MGIAGIQLAKLSGGNVIATASPSNADYLKSLGADHVLDYNSATLAEDVKAATGGRPVTYALDCRPSDTSAAVSAAVLDKEGKARYTALETGFDEVVKSLNPNVEASTVLAFSMTGDAWVYEGEHHEASEAAFEHQRKFSEVAEVLLAEGKMRAPRVFLNRGGKGLGASCMGSRSWRRTRSAVGSWSISRTNHPMPFFLLRLSFSSFGHGSLKACSRGYKWVYIIEYTYVLARYNWHMIHEAQACFGLSEEQIWLSLTWTRRRRQRQHPPACGRA